jgi:hypothetical protein
MLPNRHFPALNEDEANWGPVQCRALGVQERLAGPIWAMRIEAVERPMRLSKRHRWKTPAKARLLSPAQE